MKVPGRRCVASRSQRRTTRPWRSHSRSAVACSSVRLHHWGALLFVAALSIHMLRVFFTGAFRRPRELNWIVGVLLVIMGMAAGFTGYSLPDDLLSGNGLRIIDGIVKSLPLVGTYLSFFIFGGEFPGMTSWPGSIRCTS